MVEMEKVSKLEAAKSSRLQVEDMAVSARASWVASLVAFQRVVRAVKLPGENLLFRFEYPDYLCL